MATQRRTTTVLVSQIDGGWFDRESLLLYLLLSGFHAGILLVNHVDAALALNNLSALLVLNRPQRCSDLHSGSFRFKWTCFKQS